MNPRLKTPAWFFRLRVVAALLMASLVFWDSFPEIGPTFWTVFFLLLVGLPLTHFVSQYTKVVRWGSHFLLLSDTLILTLVLSFTGGPANPFSIVYLVYVVLAALLLGKWWTWGLAALTSSCFCSLFFFIESDSSGHHSHGHHGGEALSLHLYGMLFSYVFVAFLVAFFVSKIIDELRKREFALTDLRSSQDKLLSLTTLSAHAAHELGSPLGTIEVITHEMLESMKHDESPQGFGEDLALLSREVQRCKKIIQQLCNQSGAVTGEMPRECTLEELRRNIQRELPSQSIEWHISNPEQSFCQPLTPLLAALKGLLMNALEEGEHVECTLSIENTSFQCIICDSGGGMTKETLSHLGEPFFSSKEGGMGLGVHIAQLVAKQLRGHLSFESSPAQGTVVTFSVPAHTDVFQRHVA